MDQFSRPATPYCITSTALSLPGKAHGSMPPSSESAWSPLPAIPLKSSVRRVAFATDELGAIAVELGQTVTLAPFRIRGEPVYRVVIPILDGAGKPDAPRADVVPNTASGVTTLTLWPSLQRVDATNPWVSVVASGIIAVDLVSGVEAIFRHSGGSLTVARNGRVMVRTGPVTPVGPAQDVSGASR